MNLQGAIVEQQNLLLRFYRKLEERFGENGVIQSLWREMAGDVSMQIQSLKSLPTSTWNQFKNSLNNSFESAVNEVKETSTQTADVSNLSLRDCFEISLQLAEPVVLNIYARLIRTLRKNSTTQVLNFYILVKTFVARLLRTTQSFSGDPLLIRRAQLLLAGLEKEVQEPDPENKVPTAGTQSGKKQTSSILDKMDAKAAKETTKTTPEKVNITKETAKVSPVKNKAVSPKPAKETAKVSPVKVKAVLSKPAKETAKASPVKVKAVLSKPAKETAKSSPVKVKAVSPKPLKEKTKVSSGKVKTAKEIVKAVPPNPTKTIPVKTKALPGKSPAKTKRA